MEVARADNAPGKSDFEEEATGCQGYSEEVIVHLLVLRRVRPEHV